ncbi:hypothetical protein BV898_09381 [Hypsibius exemplaris]|uniref:Uncharacterized protein n=1 Tax=Hypsibius exemplaris TaxID=2072580 RepID=A0A1W0WMX9_HYPEX|nr:hypothetical protein BV898_09381 [Hypsibius exemplaris]
MDGDVRTPRHEIDGDPVVVALAARLSWMFKTSWSSMEGSRCNGTHGSTKRLTVGRSTCNVLEHLLSLGDITPTADHPPSKTTGHGTKTSILPME